MRKISPNVHPLKNPQSPRPSPGLPIEERIAIAFPCLLVVSGRGPGVARVPAAHTGGCTWNGRSAVPLQITSRFGKHGINPSASLQSSWHPNPVKCHPIWQAEEFCTTRIVAALQALQVPHPSPKFWNPTTSMSQKPCQKFQKKNENLGAKPG